MKGVFKGLLLLCLLMSTVWLNAQSKYTISGYVKEKGSQELLIGVNIYIPGTQTGTVSNEYGFYSLTLPSADSTALTYSFVGYGKQAFKFVLDKNIKHNVMLSPSTLLNQVEVYGNKSERISDDVRMSIVQIPIRTIQEIPSLLGEKDVFKVLQLMPGIRSGSEASSGLYVRGGGPDQNLIILDDAPVYNAAHLFGFFSVFNGDALKSVELTKGGFPARYGGRLSSVLDIHMKDGNKEKFTGNVGVGLVSSKATIEGPLIKNKASFLVSGRRTYIDALAAPVVAAYNKANDYEKNSGGYYFYDFNAKINYEISDKDKLYLSGYFGRDKFYTRLEDTWGGNTNVSEYALFWQNQTASLRWNHQFSNRLFSNASLIMSNYNFNIEMLDEYDSDKFEMSYMSGIRDYGFKYDMQFIPNPKHYIRYGIQTTQHEFRPSAVVVKNSGIDDVGFNVQVLKSLESGVYIEDEIRIGSVMKVNAGLRLTHFNHNKENYYGLEPRVLASYMITDNMSVKASYAMMNQYIHLLSNTGIGLPTDLWVPATDRIGPQKSQQVAIGIAKDFRKPAFSLSIEAYYKTMNDIISYKPGASFLMIGDPTESTDFHYEDAVTTGNGYSTGLEVLLQKKYGLFTGWVGYTLSYTRHQFDEINFGEEFFPRHDRRHDISVVGIYKLSDKITASATWVYGTGDAFTLASADYTAHTIGYGQSTVSDYESKNSYRMAAYHRLDVGVQFHKQLKKGRSRTWEVSIYNVYNRQNPFFYMTGYNEQNKLALQQVSLFPIIPSVSYNYNF